MYDESKEQIGAFQGVPELTVDIDEKKFVEYIDTYKEFSKSKKKDINYQTRVENNKRFLYGRQVTDSKYIGVYQERSIKPYEKPYIDNVIKEAEDQIRALVFSKMPDFIIKGGNREGSEKTAQNISDAVNKFLRSEEIKKVLTRAFRHHPVYYFGVIKWRWNPNKGKNGDVEFECIHPENIELDVTAADNDVDKMKIIIHYVEKPIKDWIMMFPDKEDEILNYAKKKHNIKVEGDYTEKQMAIRLKIEEVWFDWHEKKESESDETEYEFKTGVAWKMGKEILDKRLDPNWDWEGEERIFLNGQPVPEELLPQLALLGNSIEGIESEKVYRNFFSKPKKPFIILGYDQWGEMPFDESSRIEENLLLQQNYDTRGMQITKMIDEAKVKHVFSSLSGMKREDVERMDLEDPDQDIFVTGKLSEVHAFIQPQQPSGDMFGDLGRSRERILAKVSIHGATRGEVVSNTATTNQIAREQDFVAHDNLSEDTVISAATDIVQALVHMMKLRYDEEHFARVLGSDAESTHEALSFDMIEDGMEIEVFASGTDKLRAERKAKEEASLGLIDPISYFRDTGRSDPEERARMLFYFQNSPELYFKKYIEGADLPDIAEQIQLMNQQRLQATQSFGQPTQPTPQPQQATPQDTTQIATQPQGSTRGVMGGLRNMFGG